MDELQSEETFRYHHYDIELHGLYRKVADVIEGAVRQRPQEEKLLLQRKTHFQTIICSYLPDQQLPPFPSPATLVAATSPPFWLLFQLHLALADYTTVGQILDHLFKNYPDKESFVGQVEYLHFNSIREASIVETRRRMERIMDWITKTKDRMEGLPANSLSTYPPSTSRFFIWNGTVSQLRRLSKKIYERDWTRGPYTFDRAISTRRPCAWNPNRVDELLILIRELTDPHSDKRLMKVNHRRGIWKVAAALFYDNRPGSFSEEFMAKRIYEIYNRRSADFSKQLAVVRSLIALENK
ncbi:hypothetical protein [Flaviaesturariibacter amylovorans]|uniref:Uncharacterized protein n=1 Tax=Flaviaesturariibacter amylovorans TaxID=1084520 RepID=A0ABP8HTW4_9BACT